MYPLIELGPLRLSSGGLLLLLSVLLAQTLIVRAARARGDATLAEQAERCFYVALLGAAIGARLWYGVFNWSLYSQTPSLFVALRVGEFAWPGALLGGALAGFLWCRRRVDPLELADCTALALPPAQALASIGLLLSGEAFGVPTSLPWGIPLFGATRHPTQLYVALAALLSFGVLRRVASSTTAAWHAHGGLPRSARYDPAPRRGAARRLAAAAGGRARRPGVRVAARAARTALDSMAHSG